MRRLLLLPLILAAVACSEERERQSGTTLPSCTLQVCEASCTCDQTTACDPSCACDPECGQCRAAEAACRTPTTPRDAGPTSPGDATIQDPPLDASVRVDAGPCSFPVSQGLSEPCCTSFGIDACGAGLFCAAFDGRTQATCYGERTRNALETCTADNQCESGDCSATGVCAGLPGDRCTADSGCTSPVSGRWACDTRSAPSFCVELDGQNGAFCLAPSDCDSGDCTGNTCRAGTDAFCNQNEECASNACVRQACSCSPFITASCPAQQHCRFLPPDGTRCFRSGPGGLGTPCEALEDCAAPYTCAQLVSGSQPVCSEPCQPPDHLCSSGATCFMPIPTINFGVCPE